MYATINGIQRRTRKILRKNTRKNERRRQLRDRRLEKEITAVLTKLNQRIKRVGIFNVKSNITVSFRVERHHEENIASFSLKLNYIQTTLTKISCEIHDAYNDGLSYIYKLHADIETAYDKLNQLQCSSLPPQYRPKFKKIKKTLIEQCDSLEDVFNEYENRSVVVSVNHGNTFTVPFHPTTTTSSLKRTIIDKLKSKGWTISDAEIYLSFGTKPIRDGLRLGDYNIQKDSVITVTQKLTGGVTVWPQGLVNSCKDQVYKYSCAPDSLFDLLYFSVYKLGGSISKCLKGQLLRTLCESFSARDSSRSRKELLQTREAPWDWLVSHCANGFAPKYRADAVLGDALFHLACTEEEKRLLTLSFTTTTRCNNCKHKRQSDISLLPIVLSNSNEERQSNKTVSQLIVKRVKEFIDSPENKSCGKCNSTSTNTELPRIHTPEFLFVELPFIDGDNEPDIEIEENMAVFEQDYSFVGAVRAKPGHFTSIVKQHDSFFELNDLHEYGQEPQRAETLATLMSKVNPISRITSNTHKHRTGPGDFLNILLFRNNSRAMNQHYGNATTTSSQPDNKQNKTTPSTCKYTTVSKAVIKQPRKLLLQPDNKQNKTTPSTSKYTTVSKTVIKQPRKLLLQSDNKQNKTTPSTCKYTTVSKTAIKQPRKLSVLQSTVDRTQTDESSSSNSPSSIDTVQRRFLRDIGSSLPKSMQDWQCQVHPSGKVFVTVDDVVNFLGYQAVKARRGFVEIDAYIKKSNLNQQLEFIFEKGRTRTHISLDAFVTIAFMGTKSFKNQENVHALRKHLVQAMVKKVTSDSSCQEKKATEKLASDKQTPKRRPSKGVTTVRKRKFLSRPTHLLIKNVGRSKKRMRRSGELRRRLAAQREYLCDLAKNVHHGDKRDLLQAICQELETDSGKQIWTTWAGKLSRNDIMYILKNTSGSCGYSSLYDEIIRQQAAETLHINAKSILQITDNCRRNSIISEIGKMLPNFFDSKRKVEKLKNKYNEEFRCILRPQRTANGWRIDPLSLHTCLQFLYYWLPKEELWRLHGDARHYGRKHTTVINLSCINNELVLHDLKFHNPDEYWPIAVFYEKDSRHNLECNIGNGFGKPGFLEDFATKIQSEGHKIFLCGDSMFLDNVLARKGIGPLTDSGFNIYMNDTVQSKADVCPRSGLRSNLNKTFDREHTESLIPSIHVNQIGVCIDHAITRIVEKLVTLRIIKSTCLVSDIPGRDGIERRNASLLHLVENLRKRGVKSGHFDIKFDSKGNLDKPLSFNKSDARVIIAEPQDFGEGPEMDHVLHGVASDIPQQPIRDCLKEKLGLDDGITTEYEIESLILHHLNEMYKIAREDPTPKLKSGAPLFSRNVDDYSWGLTDREINEYVHHADIFHGLFIHHYGAHNLTPYMVKMIDVIPILLKTFPFKSVMRLSTEGGEHTNYAHSEHFFQRTPRGGGHHKTDTIYLLLTHRYRQLRHRISTYASSTDPVERRIAEKFEEYVTRNSAAAKIQRTFRSFLARRQKTRTTPQANDFPVNSDLLLSKFNFFLFGRIPAKLKMNKNEFVSLIGKHGGNVIENCPPKGVNIDVTILTSQLEMDKENPADTICSGYRRGWKFVSHDFITDAIKNHELQSIETYQLNTGQLSKATVGSFGEMTPEKLNFSQAVSGITRIRKKLNFERKRQYNETDLYDTSDIKERASSRAKKKKFDPLQPPKRVATYGYYVKQVTPQLLMSYPGKRSLAQRNAVIGKMWRSLSLAEREKFQKGARREFLLKKARSVSAKERHRAEQVVKLRHGNLYSYRNAISKM
ncbi:uncharacterized protein LOC144432666 [Glandiceps talaboti]